MLSIAEVDALTAAMPEPWRIAVELAAWCHLRLGEVLGLERRDIDLLHRRILVERTGYDVGGQLHLGPPKTEAGRRAVSIPPHVLPSLMGVDHLARGQADPRATHVAEDRDAVIAEALSGLAESARTASRSVYPRDIRGMTRRVHQPARPPQPTWAALLRRAADRDRTGMISLEG
jgi:integrase